MVFWQKYHLCLVIIPSIKAYKKTNKKLNLVLPRMIKHINMWGEHDET